MEKEEEKKEEVNNEEVVENTQTSENVKDNSEYEELNDRYKRLLAELVARQFQDALKRLGLEEIETIGQRFNPEFHEAVSHVEDETKGEQEIIQEYRKGYIIGNKVIRHSMVIVAN